MFRRRRTAWPPTMPGFGQPFTLDPRRARWERRRRWARHGFRATRWTARKGWTHRRGLAPAYATAGLAGLAAVGYVPHGVPAVAALWVFITLVLGVRVARRMRRKAYRRAQWAYVAAVYLAAAGWLTAALAAGPVVPVRVGLLAWFAAAGAPWWLHHRVRPYVHVELDEDERVAEWDEHVGRLVSGASLSNVADLPDPQGSRAVIGWRGDVEVPKGRKIGALLAYREEVAGIFDRDITDVDLESVGARRGVITVYTDHPLRQVRHWPGPQLFDPETGVAQIAVYGDGESALYRYYHRHNGPVHDLIAGTTGAGKSALLNSLLATERDSPFMASVVIDPQRGQSLPDWKNSCAMFARSAEEGVDVLLAVREEMYRRNEILANVRWKDDQGRWREGVDHFDPLTGPAAELGLPLLVLTIEEAHAFKGNQEAERAIEDIAKMARKCGIKLRPVLQVPLLDQLPGSTTLRDMLVGGNVICFRTANKLTAQVSFNGLDIGDPSLLPREWPDGSTTSGLCYILGPKPRNALARTFLTDDPYHWATTGETTRLWDAPAPAASPAAAARPVAEKTGTIAERAIAWLDQHEGGIATTGTIAEALDEKLPSVSQALARAAAAGRVRDLGHKLWGRLEDANTEDLAAVSAA